MNPERFKACSACASHFMQQQQSTARVPNVLICSTGGAYLSMQLYFLQQKLFGHHKNEIYEVNYRLQVFILILMFQCFN